MRLAEHVRIPYVHIELLRSENTVPARRQPVQVQGRNIRRHRDVSVPRQTDTAIRPSPGGDDEQLGVRLPRGESPVSLSCKERPTSDYVDMKKKEHDLITCQQPRTSKFAPS